jgi:hypothetical protein
MRRAASRAFKPAQIAIARAASAVSVLRGRGLGFFIPCIYIRCRYKESPP